MLAVGSSVLSVARLTCYIRCQLPTLTASCQKIQVKPIFIGYLHLDKKKKGKLRFILIISLLTMVLNFIEQYS